MNSTIAKTDAQIKHDVLDELKWDTRVKETDVGVEVHAGTVTLSGTVDSWTTRLAAQEAAHRVQGVLDVANEVSVKLPGSFERDDTDIAKAVRAALEWDVLVPQGRIRTTVSKGIVTLEGSVDHWSQYDDAARAVRNLFGVREVNNRIVVEPPTAPDASPQRVRSNIERALERHAGHAAKRVHIEVSGGKVTLTGDVPSWSERKVIEGAVRGTPGVWNVVSQLRVVAAIG